MRKNFLLTSLLMLVATFSMAQEISKFPITLTTADGLPGPKIVQNFVYKSQVFNLEEAVSVLRFTVCSTNTVDTLTSGSYDGLSAGWGTGIPFFTMSEFRIYDGNGKQIEYIANSNAIQRGDGGGLAVLNDGKENNHFHSVYSRSCNPYPYEYHYLEFELAEPVSSFSFNWNTRSKYYKNLITYMGITPGTDYIPFPEQEFTLGEQVKSVEEFAQEGALFVLRGCADEYPNPFDNTDTLVHMVPGNLFMHAPYGGTITPSAADLFYLIPDVDNEKTYKLCWLNNGHYILAHKYTGKAGKDEWAHWTNNIMNAASLEFTPCDTVEGNFSISMDNKLHYIGYDGYGRMGLIADEDSAMYRTSRPTSYSWTIYNASINGAAIAAQLQVEIDEAHARIEAIGGNPGYCDCGIYEELLELVEEAEALVAKEGVTAAEILTTKRLLNRLTAAYAAEGLWNYVDSIAVIGEMVDEEEIALCEAPDWVDGGYSQEAFDAMTMVADNVQLVIEKCESLADVDAAIADIYAAIAAFWATKVSNVVELPFRVGSTEDGLPGTNISSVWVWESPMYLLSEETDALRFTAFKTVSGRNYNGFPFLCINEMEFYDHNGKKIALTEENFSTNSLRIGDGIGLAGLCDGGTGTNAGTHFHSVWGSTGEDLNPMKYEGTEYVWIEISFPEPICGFKYVQYGRGNGAYADSPTDFVFSAAGETYTPDDISFPDLYNTKLGEQVTDASQITDDGLYALVGLINCAPEGDGTGYEKFYSSNTVYGKEIGAPCAFTITKTGDNDGSFYIRSLADSKYWSRTLDEDGWSGSNTTASDIADAGKFFIVPNAEARAAAGMQEFPNSFAIYQYNDTVKRSNDKIDDTGAPVPHPYIVVQDWGGNTGFFSIPDLTFNDFDGEGEWYIYKMTMDNPYIYWLNGVYASVAGQSLKVGPDPGFYSQASAGEFAKALTMAQVALEANDNAAAKAALLALEAASDDAMTAEVNPMVPGKYVIETAYADFFTKQGVSKAMCSYFNDFEDGGATSEYSLWWTDAPADLENPAIYYQFEFISATNCEQVQTWLQDSVITAEDAANAYHIKSVEIGQYVASSTEHKMGVDIGFTAEPEYAYIVRPQGAYQFGLWCPVDPNLYMHMQDHGGGSGTASDVIYWYGGADGASSWVLRSIDARTSINNLTVEPEGDVVSTYYYTTAGAAVPAPVKGINIVKKVYANGAVETSKIYVK